MLFTNALSKKFQLQVEYDNKNITLADICYAPMTDEFSGPPTINFCTIRSALGYFGTTSEDFINYDDKSGRDPLNQLMTCIMYVARKKLQNFIYSFFSAPYSSECLAPYGGPVEPGLAFGGAENLNFTDSSGLALTFLVKNHLDNDKLKLALLWEKKYWLRMF